MHIHMMRTTVQLDNHLLLDAKQYAARTGKTLTSLIADGLRLILARRVGAKQRATFVLPTFRGEGLQPGVDLDHTASLLDLMDQER